MRLLHTSDWHLGHALHQVERDVEHAHFLDWLIGTVVAESIDAILITGDVFDNANPSAAAQAQWFDFLHRVTRARPGVEVVVIAGNHDSPSRLEAPARLLAPMGVRVVGRVRYLPDGRLDVASLVIPLCAGGRVVAQVAAVPFLRPSDLRVSLLEAMSEDGDDDAGADPLIEGVRAIYDQVADYARSIMSAGHRLVVTGHLYAAGTELSRLSERRVLGGNQHALPLSVFPAGADYVALGHLHKAQRVGRRDHVRYAGSPIPLSMGEAHYRHQVLVVDLGEERGAGVVVTPRFIPRAVELVRVPARGSAPLSEVVAELARLPEPGPEHVDRAPPFLEVSVRLDDPYPNLRREIEEVVAGRWVRLVKLGVEYTGTGAGLADGAQDELRDLDPVQVFARRYQRDHEGEVPPPLLAAFHEVLAEALEGEP